MGSPWDARNQTLAELRVWPIRKFENYLIFYRPVTGGIEVLRVLHAARDIVSPRGGLYFPDLVRLGNTSPKKKMRASLSAIGPQDLSAEVVWQELRPVLDQELSRLPEKYRAPVVLCYLQGKSYEEAAQQLGCSRGTVSTRLTRARELLRGRLARRGLSLTTGLLATAFSQEAASGSVPIALVATTVRSAAVLGIHGAVVGSGVSAHVATLAGDLLHALFMTKVKLALALVLGVSLVSAGAGLVAHQALAVKAGWKKQSDGPQPAAQRTAEPKSLSERPIATDLYGGALPSGALVRMGTVRLRHDGSFTGITFSPDGKTIATAGWGDGSIRLWELPTGRLRLRIDSGDAQLTGLALSPDGTVLASVGFTLNQNKRWVDGTVRLWEFATGKQVRRIERADWRPSEIAFSPDGTILATGAQDGSIRLWDATTGTERFRTPPHARTDWVHTFISLVFSPDGRILAAANPNDSIRLWDPASGKELRKLEAGPDPISSRLSFSSDGKTLAAVERRYLRGVNRSENDVVLWDVASGKVRRLQGHRHTGSGRVNLFDVAFSPDGQTLASTGSDRTLLIWDVATRKCRHTIQGPPNGAYHLAFSPDGRTLAGGGFDDTVYLWDVATGSELTPAAEGHTSAVSHLVFSPDGKTLATAGDDSTIRLWEAATGRPLVKLAGHEYWVRAIAFSPNGKLLASSGLDDSVRLWDVASGKQLHQLPGHGKLGGFRCLAFSLDGKAVASWGDDWTLRVWETGSGMRLLECQPRLNGVPEFPGAGDKMRRDKERERRAFSYRASFTPDGKNLVLFSDDRTHIIDTATGQEAFTISGLPPRNACAISPDGKMLISDSGNVGRLIEVASGKEMLQIDGLSQASAIAFSPDGKSVAASVGEEQAVVRIWELRTGQELHHFQAPASVRSLAFSPDGKTLATGLADTTALIWDLGPAAVRSGQTAKALASQDLEKLWVALADADARKAYRAMWTLTTVPEKAVALFKVRLQPAAEADARRIRRRIADLGSDRFSVREDASRELEHLGAAAEPFLREALAGDVSPEVRRRLQALLAVPPALIRSAEVLRRARAIQVLERIGSPDAQQVLQKMAKGAPRARETQAAKASLERLARRPAATP